MPHHHHPTSKPVPPLIRAIVRNPRSPFYGLRPAQAARIFDAMEKWGMLDDGLKEVLCEACFEPRQVIAAKCPGRGCPSPKMQTPKLKARDRWQVSAEARAETADAELHG